MQIRTAAFLKSAELATQCPPQNLPEFAFIGRSNVGKSSLINCICNHKGLAKVSSTPGKTKLINYFVINKEWYLVDLPGYGYAKTSKSQKKGFAKIITKYLESRDQLTCLFVLVDSRHEPQKIDLEFMNLLGTHGIPFAIVFTKIDKIKESELKKNIEIYEESLSESWDELPRMFCTSSSKMLGADDLLNFVEECIEFVNTKK